MPVNRRQHDVPSSQRGSSDDLSCCDSAEHGRTHFDANHMVSAKTCDHNTLIRVICAATPNTKPTARMGESFLLRPLPRDHPVLHRG